MTLKSRQMLLKAGKRRDGELGMAHPGKQILGLFSGKETGQ